MNQIVCKEGIYDKFDGCTDWKMTHSSQSERDQLKVYTRKRPSGEEDGHQTLFTIDTSQILYLQPISRVADPHEEHYQQIFHCKKGVFN